MSLLSLVAVLKQVLFLYNLHNCSPKGYNECLYPFWSIAIKQCILADGNRLIIKAPTGSEEIQFLDIAGFRKC